MTRKLVLAASLAAFALPATVVEAAPPWERESRVHKYEYEVNGCKYEYKSTPGITKEKVKCKDDRVAWRPAPQPVLPSFPPIDLGRCYSETAGQIIGGALGGLAGSRIGEGTGKVVAVAGGTLFGFLIGGEIGRSIDANDRACANQIFESVPAGQPVLWQSPAQDRQYQVVPAAPFTDNGRYCRQYHAEVLYGGRHVDSTGTACRQGDGSWQIVS